MSCLISPNQFNCRKNLELGVMTGMVRAVEDCRSGLDAFKERFSEIDLSGNSSGVLKEWYTAKFRSPNFLSSLNRGVEESWKASTRRTVKQSINLALEEGIGKPVLDLIRYLENEHMSHCLPSNVSRYLYLCLSVRLSNCLYFYPWPSNI